MSVFICRVKKHSIFLSSERQLRRTSSVSQSTSITRLVRGFFGLHKVVLAKRRQVYNAALLVRNVSLTIAPNSQHCLHGPKFYSLLFMAYCRQINLSKYEKNFPRRWFQYVFFLKINWSKSFFGCKIKMKISWNLAKWSSQIRSPFYGTSLDRGNRLKKSSRGCRKYNFRICTTCISLMDRLYRAFCPVPFLSADI